MSTLIAQTSGVRAAANAVITASGAHPDDDVPAYENSPFEYEDDLGWEDEDEAEITHAGGEARDLAAVVHQYIMRPGYVIYVLDHSPYALTKL